MGAEASVWRWGEAGVDGDKLTSSPAKGDWVKELWSFFFAGGSLGLESPGN